jgi:hypothetical protein
MALPYGGELALSDARTVEVFRPAVAICRCVRLLIGAGVGRVAVREKPGMFAGLNLQI